MNRLNPMEIREPSSLTLSIIIPAYNEEQIITTVIGNVRAAAEQTGESFEILVINDGSTDDTAHSASLAGACVLSHPYNIGNGAAVKTGIRAARGEVILMIDGDGQHRAEDIPRLVQHFPEYDMVVGARTRQSVAGWHRRLANYTYNWLASYVCGRKIDDLTSGFRAIKTHIAREFLSLLPNTFSYPTTLTLAVVRSGYSLLYEPVTTHARVGKSKIHLLRDGSRFFLIIFKVTTLFSPLKIFIPISILMFLLGFGYGLFKIIFLGQRYGPTSAMLMTVSVLIFMVGLVSEQVAQLRFQKPDPDFSQREPPYSR
jgi:glycosyltransferase involved in cell wall biosynthesis